MIHIRRATPQDKPGELILKGAMREGRGDLIIVVLEEQRLIGCCSMEIQGNRGIINSLFMLEDKRKQGIGDGLVRSALFTAQRQNVEWVEVPERKETGHFFKRMGFKSIDGNPKTLQLNLDGFFKSCSCSCSGDGKCHKEGC